MVTTFRVPTLVFTFFAVITLISHECTGQPSLLNQDRTPTVDSVWSSVGDTLRMGAIVSLRLTNIDSFLTMAKPLSKQPILFVNDIPIWGLYSTINPKKGVVSFQLSSNDTSRPTWARFQSVEL